MLTKPDSQNNSASRAAKGPVRQLEPWFGLFILKNSFPSQMFLLAVTLCSLPLVYASLELPKRIMNGAINDYDDPVTIFGHELLQTEYLWLLCAIFIVLVLIQGLLKMQTNIWKSLTGERLLIRFRFRLLSNLFRFPLARFRTTSQGELVSMITAESEPLGEMMGEFVAQPVSAAGQLITIVLFLFIQSPWLALSAIALVPVQAVLIPYLQKRINRLHRERVRQMRGLSEQIGETVSNMEDLRGSGAVILFLANFSRRFGTLFQIRQRIATQKAIMKFANNMLNQMTPFMFFAIGGYLVIMGSLDVGALVAALAAYKDVAELWREVLYFVNRIQETSDRYRVLVDQFQPGDIAPGDALSSPFDRDIRLDGDIVMSDVSTTDNSGNELVSDISLRIPKSEITLFAVADQSVSRTMVRLLSGTELPAGGTVDIGGYSSDELHYGTLALRVGVVTNEPKLFNGTIGQNVNAPLAWPVGNSVTASGFIDREKLEIGMLGSQLQIDRIDPTLAGVENEAELNAWWATITHAIGSEQFLFETGLNSKVEDELHDDIKEGVVALRGKIEEAFEAEDIGNAVIPFDARQLSSCLTLAENFFYALYLGSHSASIGGDDALIEAIDDQPFAPRLLGIAQDMVQLVFGQIGNLGKQHPAIKRIMLRTGADFEALRSVQLKLLRTRPEKLDPKSRTLLYKIALHVVIEEVVPSFPSALARRIVAARVEMREGLPAGIDECFAKIDRHTFNPAISVLENAIFGRLSALTERQERQVIDIVTDILEQSGLRQSISSLILDTPAGVEGKYLPKRAHERVALVRAVIKRPDILILERPLASETLDVRSRAIRNLHKLLPDMTIVIIEPEVPHQFAPDHVFEIVNGSLKGSGHDEHTSVNELEEKRRLFARTETFRNLRNDQLRSLAFASRWITVKKGEHIFRPGDTADAAYVLESGKAELRWPGAGLEAEVPVTTVEPGRLIGDLSVFIDRPREQFFIAIEAVRALQIRREELMQIIENDPLVATSLLRAVSNNLFMVASLRAAEKGYPTSLTEQEERDWRNRSPKLKEADAIEM